MKKENEVSSYEGLDLGQVKTRSIENRRSKVHLDQFARVVPPQEWFDRLDETLPRILAGDVFRQVVNHVLRAVERRRPVILMLGAHVIKCGLSTLIVDLIQRGVVSTLALNGAGAIHDVEIALWGHTSEDVDSSLARGWFGMTAQTAEFINGALAQAKAGEGFGECLGRALSQTKPKHGDHSLLLSCFLKSRPVTVHVALGTDVIHQHPSADGAIVGELSFRDFRILAQSISGIGDGGVVINVGSAVILPEVFLKCLSLVRNRRRDVRDFITVNLDMIQHYRPTVNVVQRPAKMGGRGYQLTGHHEIMIPLLTAAIRHGLERTGAQEEKPT